MNTLYVCDDVSMMYESDIVYVVIWRKYTHNDILLV